MSTENTNTELVPVLRFPEFEGEWESKKLEDLAKIKYGKDQKQVVCDNGRYPILGTGGEMGRTNEFLYDKPSVLIGRKGTIDKPKYMDTPFWTVDTLFYTEVLSITFPKWLFYRFETINWYLYNEASGVPSLSGSTIYKIPISLPTLPEQKRIASFFTVLDQKLSQLKQKKNLLAQYKKSVMQQLFSQELRFKDDDGNEFPDWESKKLGEVALKIGDGLHGTPNYSTNTGCYFINGNNLTNGQITITENTKEITSKDYFANQKGLTKNTLLISINGTIGNVAKYNDEKVMLGKSVGYFTFRNDCNFYYHLLNSEIIQNYFISELTGSTIKNLSLKTLRETEFLLPTLEEQTKIANFLSAIDEKINQTQTQIGKTEQYKKGLLQKMFC